MIRRDEPITFRGLAQTAGVSLDFLYRYAPRSASGSNSCGAQQQSTAAATGSTAPTPTSPSSVVRTLTAQLAELKRRHRDEVHALRQALEAAHGENLELRRRLGPTLPPGSRLEDVELLIAANPDPDSRLPYLLRLPLGGGMVFRTSGTWPRTKALYCHPMSAEEWPAHPDIVERVALRSCRRRGAAIDLVLDRARENRSQLVFTTARGRDVVFWQSPRTRKQARPNVRTPTARAAGIAELEIVVDSHEQYPYRFTGQQVRTVKRALPCGDYGITVDGRLVASVERKSLPDLVASLTGGKLRYALAELAALPRAAVVVEDRYSAIFKLDRVRPAQIADGLAELQVRWPNVPIVFCETRPLAEEWTYRFLAAAQHLGRDRDRLPGAHRPARLLSNNRTRRRTGRARPSTAEVRAWARATGITVPDRGRLRPEIWDAWRTAHHR